VSVIGYPLGADIFGPWLTVNALVPLAIPAGAGVAVLYRWGREAIEEGDGLEIGIITFVALLVVAQVAWTGVGAVYMHPQADANGLVQFGQPGDDLASTFDEIEAVSDGSRGPDVVFYGPALYGPGLPTDPDKQLAVEPQCANLGATLPIQWYLRTNGLTATCARTPGELSAVSEAPPPAIVADPAVADEIDIVFPTTYERRTLLVSSRANPAGTARGQLALFVDTNRSTGR
jgi:predicted membrane-bound mannosyltransferase